MQQAQPLPVYGITKVEYARQVQAFEERQAFQAKPSGPGLFDRLLKRLR